MNPKNKNPLAFISRRRLLSACGAVGLGLPALELFWPRSAHAASENAKLVAFYVPNGKHMQDWTPKTEGFGFELPYILEPLAAHMDEYVVVLGPTLTDNESVTTCEALRTAAPTISSPSPEPTRY